MPRRRLAVALLAPVGVSDRIDTLRRAVGVAEPFHVPPHITLVPPVNVGDEDMPEVLMILGTAAKATRQFALDIGPAATFAPATPTLHLTVGGSETALAGLSALRAAVRAGTLERPDEWPFTPHVTLQERHPEGDIAAAVAVLSGVRDVWVMDRLHLLEQRRRDDGSVVWIPVREEQFGGPAVVGRGGIELVLRTVGMVEEPVTDLCGVVAQGPLPGPDAPIPLVVAAEAPDAVGVPVGAAVGSTGGGPVAVLEALVVEPDERDRGVAAHLLSAWCSSAASRGASMAVAVEAGHSGFLERHGFIAAGDSLVRHL